MVRMTITKSANGLPDYHLYKGNKGRGAQGNVKISLFYEKSLKIQTYAFNKGSLIEYINSKNGNKKLKKGILGFFGGTSDAKVKDAFNQLFPPVGSRSDPKITSDSTVQSVNTPQDKPLVPTTKPITNLTQNPPPKKAPPSSMKISTTSKVPPKPLAPGMLFENVPSSINNAPSKDAFNQAFPPVGSRSELKITSDSTVQSVNTPQHKPSAPTTKPIINPTQNPPPKKPPPSSIKISTTSKVPPKPLAPGMVFENVPSSIKNAPLFDDHIKSEIFDFLNKGPSIEAQELRSFLNQLIWKKREDAIEVLMLDLFTNFSTCLEKMLKEYISKAGSKGRADIIFVISMMIKKIPDLNAPCAGIAFSTLENILKKYCSKNSNYELWNEINQIGEKIVENAENRKKETDRSRALQLMEAEFLDAFNEKDPIKVIQSLLETISGVSKEEQITYVSAFIKLMNPPKGSKAVEIIEILEKYFSNLCAADENIVVWNELNTIKQLCTN